MSPIGRRKECQPRRYEQNDGELKEMGRGPLVAVWRGVETAKKGEDGRAKDQNHREERKAEHHTAADPVESLFTLHVVLLGRTPARRTPEPTQLFMDCTITKMMIATRMRRLILIQLQGLEPEIVPVTPLTTT